MYKREQRQYGYVTPNECKTSTPYGYVTLINVRLFVSDLTKFRFTKMFWILLFQLDVV